MSIKLGDLLRKHLIGPGTELKNYFPIDSKERKNSQVFVKKINGNEVELAIIDDNGNERDETISLEKAESSI